MTTTTPQIRLTGLPRRLVLVGALEEDDALAALEAASK